MRGRQFTLQSLFGAIAAFAIILALLVAGVKWINATIMDIEREAARDCVLEWGSDTQYDRDLLGEEFDTLKSEFELLSDLVLVGLTYHTIWSRDVLEGCC